MFSYNWLLSLVVCASIPLVAIIIPLFERSLLKKWRTARNAYSRFVGWLAEAINGSKTIKTLSIEEEVSGEAKSIVQDIQDKRWKAAKTNALFQPLVSFISMIMQLCKPAETRKYCWRKRRRRPCSVESSGYKPNESSLRVRRYSSNEQSVGRLSSEGSALQSRRELATPLR